MDTHTLTDIAYKERVYKTTAPQVNDTFSIQIPPDLRERRLYTYLETIATGQNWLKAIVTLKYLGQPLAKIPVEVGTISTQTQGRSLWSFLNFGGSAVGDCLVYTLFTPFVPGTNQVTIQPLRLNGTFDEMEYRTDEISTGNTGWRAMIACVSAQLT